MEYSQLRSIHLRHSSDGRAKNCGRLSQTLHKGTASRPKTNHVDCAIRGKTENRAERLGLAEKRFSAKQDSGSTDHCCLLPRVRENFVRLEEETGPEQHCSTVSMHVTCKQGAGGLPHRVLLSTLQRNRKSCFTVGEAVWATGTRKGTERRPLVAGAVDGRCEGDPGPASPTTTPTGP